MQKVVIILSLFLTTSILTKAQSGLDKLTNVYEEAIEKANLENKDLLFYFYSPYCYDCPLIDSLFSTGELAGKIESDFITVKINKEHPVGQRLVKKFKLRFIPSVILTDTLESNITLLDDGIDEEKLLKYTRFFSNEYSRSTEYSEALGKKRKMARHERIDKLYDFRVMDDFYFEVEKPINLYNQSYLHKTLNDGLAHEHAIKYLKTQTDLSSPENKQFILDFVDDSRMPGFTYLKDNIRFFRQEFGKDIIDSLVANIVHKRLYQSWPSPGYNEVVELMKMISPEQADRRTYDFLIDLSLKTNQVEAYLFLQKKYIKKFAPKDHERMVKMADVYLQRTKGRTDINVYIDYVKTATKIKPDSIDYVFTMVLLQERKKDKCEALKYAAKCLKMATENDKENDYIVSKIMDLDKLK